MPHVSPLRPFVVVAVSLACVFTAASFALAAQKLRIMAYNCEILAAPGESLTISKYRWDIARRQQFERIAAVIESLEPDIVNLEEVTSKAAVDLLVEILHDKGLKQYRGYHAESRDGFMRLDVAVISKYEPEVVEGESIRCLYSDKDDPTWRANFLWQRKDGSTGESTTSITRNGLYFITVGQHKLGFLGLHLKSNPDDPYANGRRTGEAEVARRIVQKEIVARGFTPIVLGDLNDYDEEVPDQDESRSTKTNVLRILKDYDEDSQGMELVNAASKVVRQKDRYTSHWDRNENGADDIGDVKTMLDHILLHKSLMPHVQRVFISHAQSLETSDHFPVVVDLQLP